MNFYRIKQFYWAINSTLTPNSIHFVESNLNLNELKLFNKLSISEKQHCINVAYDVIGECKLKNLKPDLLIKAALLHDIGKIYKKLNIIDKSFMVIADNLSNGYFKKFSNIEKINVYYNHGKIGRDILKRYNEEERLLYLVENHSNFSIDDDIELYILRKCDSRN